MGTKQTKKGKQQNVWEAAGIKPEDVGDMWFQPDGRWRKVVVRGIEKPEQPVKTLDDGTAVSVYAVLTVEDERVTKTWEVCSKQLLRLLMEQARDVPADLWVRRHGNPPRRVYEVSDVDPRDGTDLQGKRTLMPHARNGGA